MASISSRAVVWILFGLFLLPPAIGSIPAAATQWVNPKIVIGDPMKARLQQGRKDLTAVEKEEIAKYGYTGLELMTYVFANKHPQPDTDFGGRCINYDGVSLSEVTWLFRRRYFYKDILDKITNRSVKPGDREYQLIGYDVDSPRNRGFGILATYYAQSPSVKKNWEQMVYLPSLRRIRKDTPWDRTEEILGMITTTDDDEGRDPWVEEHRILGEDSYKGQAVFLVESRDRTNPNYYLGKRVSWVDKTHFLDHHEEQFDRNGHLYNILEHDWIQVRPTNHWFARELNMVKLPKGERTLHQQAFAHVGVGLTDADFSTRALEAGKPWRMFKHNFPPVRSLSDLPPLPKARFEVWEKTKGSQIGK
jgi:hypothetical protein